MSIRTPSTRTSARDGCDEHRAARPRFPDRASRRTAAWPPVPPPCRWPCRRAHEAGEQLAEDGNDDPVGTVPAARWCTRMRLLRLSGWCVEIAAPAEHRHTADRCEADGCAHRGRRTTLVRELPAASRHGQPARPRSTRVAPWRSDRDGAQQARYLAERRGPASSGSGRGPSCPFTVLARPSFGRAAPFRRGVDAPAPGARKPPLTGGGRARGRRGSPARAGRWRARRRSGCRGSSGGRRGSGARGPTRSSGPRPPRARSGSAARR